MIISKIFKSKNHVIQKLRYQCLSKVAQDFQYVNFKSFDEWTQITTALDKLGNNVSGPHLGAAFNRAKDLLPRPTNQFLETLSNKVIQNISSLDTRSVTTIFHSCASLKFFNPDFFDKLTDVFLEQIYFVDFEMGAKLVFALGELQGSWEQSRCPLPEDYLENKANSELKKLNMFLKQESLLLAVTSKVTFKFCVQMYDPAWMSLMLSGLANLRYKPPRLMDELRNLIIYPMHLTKTPAKTIHLMLNAVSRLNYRNMELIKELTNEVSREPKVSELKNHELSSVIYSIGRLNLGDKNVLMALLEKATMNERLCNYSNRGLSNILYGLSLLHVNSRTIAFYNYVGIFMKEAAKLDRIETYSEQDITTIMYASGILKCAPEEMLDAICKEVNERLNKFTLRGISTILHGFSKSGFKNGQMLKPVLEYIAQHDNLKILYHENLAYTLHALTELGFKKCKEMETVIIETTELRRLKYYTVISLANIMRALDKLDIQNWDSFKFEGFDTINEVKFDWHHIINLCAKEAIREQRINHYNVNELRDLILSLVKFSKRKEESVFIKEITKPEKIKELEIIDLVTLIDKANFELEDLDKVLDELLHFKRYNELAVENLTNVLDTLANKEYRYNKINIMIDLILEPKRFKGMGARWASLFESMCKLGYEESLIMEKVLNEILKKDWYLTFNDKYLNSILNGLAILRPKVHRMIISKKEFDKLTSQCLYEVKKRVINRNYEEGIELIESASKLGYGEKGMFYSIINLNIQKWTSKQILDNMLYLTRVLNIMSHLDNVNETIQNRAINYIKDIYKSSTNDIEFKVRNVITLDFIISVLESQIISKMLNEDDFSKILDLIIKIKSEDHHKTLNKEQFELVLNGFNYIKLINKDNNIPNNQSQKLLLEKAHDIVTEVQQIKEFRTKTEVYGCLNKLYNLNEELNKSVLNDNFEFIEENENVLKNVYLNELCLNVDFMLDKRKIVECVSLSDYDFNHERIIGKRNLKYIILKACGYEIFYVPIEEFESKLDEEKKEFVKKIIMY